MLTQEVKLQPESVIGGNQYRMKTKGVLENDGVAWSLEGEDEERGKKTKGSGEETEGSGEETEGSGE